MKVKGEWKNRRVYVQREGGDWKELRPARSQRVYNHSPDGFNWGYCGSGPAQLALALMLEEFGEDNPAIYRYQDFKRDFVASILESDFEREIDLREWLKEKENQEKEEPR